MERLNAKPGKEKNGVNRCLLLMLLSLLIANIALVCVGAIIFTRMQGRIDELRQRELLLNVGDEKKVELRVRRGVVYESEHERKYHHGIGSFAIALIYGDPNISTSNITTWSRRDDPGNSNWEKLPKSSSNQCKPYFRADGQNFCKNLSGQSFYMTNTSNKRYQHFRKAEWMNTHESLENYELKPDGNLTVKVTGLYIVHASVFFQLTAKMNRPHYRISRTDSKGKNDEQITSCQLRVDYNKDKGIHHNSGSCQTLQLVHLSANDQVYMAIGGDVWFRVDKNSLHLALIKLNNDTVH